MDTCLQVVEGLIGYIHPWKNLSMSRIFGKLPSGNRLERVKASPQYQRGKFANQSVTPDLAEDATMWKVLRAFRNKPVTVKPQAPIPVLQPDFNSLSGKFPGV